MLKQTVVISYENRKDRTLGLELLGLSIKDRCPDVRLILPSNEEIDSLFPIGHCIWNTWERLSIGMLSAKKWNIKPDLLLRTMELIDFNEIWWIDADAILIRDPRVFFSSLDKMQVVGTEEPKIIPIQGSSFRTKAWGLEVGNEYARTLNSSFLRFTKSHVPLLQDWKKLLELPEYLEATHPRPRHMVGDQDVLCALLGSLRYDAFPLRMLTSEHEICHINNGYGYGLRARFSWISKKNWPAIVHLQGNEPWRDSFSDNEKVQLSPYSWFAKKYIKKTSLGGEWRKTNSFRYRTLNSLFANQPFLRDLPYRIIVSIKTNLRIRSRIKKILKS